MFFLVALPSSLKKVAARPDDAYEGEERGSIIRPTGTLFKEEGLHVAAIKRALSLIPYPLSLFRKALMLKHYSFS